MITAQDLPQDQEGLRKKTLYFHPSKWIFYLIFASTYLVSGIITMIDVIPYQMGLMTAFILPLLLLYRLKIDRVIILYSLLTLIIILSAIYNNSPIIDLFLFSRTLIFSFLIYYLVNVYVKKDNITFIIRLCVMVGIIQLPIVIFQLLTYDWLPTRIAVDISALDYDFGTFNFKGDYSMTFFLALLVIFLLFDKKRNHIIPYRIFIVLWFTTTILVANADISKVIIMLIWAVYFLTHINRKIGIFLLGTLTLVLVLFMASDFWTKIGEDVTHKISVEFTNFITGSRVDVYLSGGYARGGALYYFLTNDLLILGDGPSKYIDPITNHRIRGNVGHFFTFYSEVGILGLLLSMLIFLQISFRYYHGRIRLTWVTILSFIAISILSFTSHIMNDISVVLIYSIIAKSHLIPRNNKLGQNGTSKLSSLL